MERGAEQSGDGDALAAAAAAVAAWQTTHPQASLAALEAVVEAELGSVRAWLLSQAVARQEAAALGACPRCGGTLQGRGAHVRTLQVAGRGRLTLRRTYATCPACGEGLFPPG